MLLPMVSWLHLREDRLIEEMGRREAADRSAPGAGPSDSSAALQDPPEAGTGNRPAYRLPDGGARAARTARCIKTQG